MHQFLIPLHHLPNEDEIQQKLINFIKNLDIEFILHSTEFPKRIKISHWLQKENDRIIFALKLELDKFEISYLRSQNGNSLKELIRIRNGSTANSPIIENYTYDPFGMRVKIERNDSAQTKIYTPFKELMRIINSSGSYDFTYIYQDGVLVARVNPDGSKYYYHPDHLGSTSLITDANGNVVEQTFYSPFGETLGGGTTENKLYTGQFADITNQYYYGARYYKPGTGQFVQADTIISKIYDPQSMNKYSYTLNNPYKYTDPSGKSPIVILIEAYVVIQEYFLIPMMGALSEHAFAVLYGTSVQECAEGSCENLVVNTVLPSAGKVAGEIYGNIRTLSTPPPKTPSLSSKDIEGFNKNMGGTGGKTSTASIPTKSLNDLPKEARNTIKTIEEGGPFKYSKDSSIWRNEERPGYTNLPQKPEGYYREYTVETPSAKDRGEQRIVIGQDKEIYYTSDHYKTFTKVIKD